MERWHQPLSLRLAQLFRRNVQMEIRQRLQKARPGKTRRHPLAFWALLGGRELETSDD
jgi:hypothetical protein